MSPLAFVFLHGFLGDAGAWERVRAALPAHAAFLPALLGHGEDGGDAETFTDEVDRLARRIESAGMRGAHLVGYSLGARVALGLLVRHPRLFSRATLIGANPGLPGAAARSERIAADERWAERLTPAGLPAFLAAWEAQPVLALHRPIPDAIRAQMRARRLRHDPAGLAKSLRVLGLGQMPDFTPALAGIPVFVHLVAGARDDKFVALSQAMLPRLPRARLTLVPGAGHNVPLEAPEPLAAALISPETDT